MRDKLNQPHTGIFFWVSGKKCRFLRLKCTKIRQELHFRAINRLGTVFAFNFTKKGGPI